MVISFTMRFFSGQPITLHVFSGFLVRGVFFHGLRLVDEKTATHVHEQRTLSPYSVSPILNERGVGIFRGTIYPGTSFYFRVTALDEHVGDVFGKFLFAGEVPEIKLNSVSVSLQEVAVETWSPGKPAFPGEFKRFVVDFRSPTYFRNTQKGNGLLESLLPRRLRKKRRPMYRYVIVPDPYLFFRNLARLYRRFGHGNFRYKSFSEWLLEGGVALETFSRLRAYKVYDDRGRWSRGFVGRAVFDIPHELYDERMAKICFELLNFARFSNVGGNRTAGFGVVSYRFSSSG